MAKSFASSKVTVVIGDGCEYLREHREKFDVIITDSSDPDGEFSSKRSFFQIITRIFQVLLVVYSKKHSIH